MKRLAAASSEFLNRFNRIVGSVITKNDLGKIVDLMLEDVNKTFVKGITLTVTDAAKDWLIAKVTMKRWGARPLRRVIERNIRDKVTGLPGSLEDKKLQARLD